MLGSYIARVRGDISDQLLMQTTFSSQGFLKSLKLAIIHN